MLTPYRLPSAREVGNDIFDTGHASLRVICEHGNGLLKGRWSSLVLLHVAIRNERDVQFVCNWILACCVLHNIVNRLRNGEDDVPLYCETSRASQVSNAIPQDNCLIMRENMKSELLHYLGFTEK
ncbi:hypothetical protein DYB25_003461 [Aphanomyces astaci]|uniref:DDE Tnp4 domain-containing protein n=1 Tax=Aphanomyces astaci TaxID=112090 RepID=A0A397BL76_APHAT|nr:hypothetical protein DYB25_003461 [Aphanomyces astaci]